MLKKVVLHSVATALANNVFPVPGGPESKFFLFNIGIELE